MVKWVCTNRRVSHAPSSSQNGDRSDPSTNSWNTSCTGVARKRAWCGALNMDASEWGGIWPGQLKRGIPTTENLYITAKGCYNCPSPSPPRALWGGLRRRARIVKRGSSRSVKESKGGCKRRGVQHKRALPHSHSVSITFTHLFSLSLTLSHFH